MTQRFCRRFLRDHGFERGYVVDPCAPENCLLILDTFAESGSTYSVRDLLNLVPLVAFKKLDGSPRFCLSLVGNRRTV